MSKIKNIDNIQEMLLDMSEIRLIHCFDEEEHQRLIKENKELKEKYSKLEDKYIKNLPCCNEEDCSLYNHAINTDYILTEFEKWLEEKINSPKLSLIEIITFKRCLEELQELKEGKNEKSND